MSNAASASRYLHSSWALFSQIPGVSGRGAGPTCWLLTGSDSDVLPSSIHDPLNCNFWTATTALVIWVRQYYVVRIHVGSQHSEVMFDGLRHLGNLKALRLPFTRTETAEFSRCMAGLRKSLVFNMVCLLLYFYGRRTEGCAIAMDGRQSPELCGRMYAELATYL